MCYNTGMDVLNTLTTTDIVQVLRERLVPAEQADTLVDELAGAQPQARQAAVLLPLFLHDGVLSTLFIRRSRSLRLHSGEIAFPGGRVEAQDSSPAATAIREAQEEIGLDPLRVQVLGALTPVFTVVSNFLIMPIVAFLPSGPGPLMLQESEVSEVIVVPLHHLADPTIARTEEWMRDGQKRTVYFYDYTSCCIWGATGHILSHFLTVLRFDGSSPA
ncbi:MAG TPA: CoA pyrophosphatase [Dictyobacter sp.]|nr:CoA pyrophosphatase [Dictyobacter sp.]